MKYFVVFLVILSAAIPSRSQTKIIYDSNYEQIADSVVNLNLTDSINDTSIVYNSNQTGRFYIKFYENDKQLPDAESIRRGIPLVCHARTSHDTLYIEGFWGLNAGFSFSIAVTGDTFDSFYTPVTDTDILTLDRNSSLLTSYIDVPAQKQKLILTQKPVFKEGESVKGFLDMTSNHFYEKNGGILNDYRVQIKIYFSEQISKK